MFRQQRKPQGGRPGGKRGGRGLFGKNKFRPIKERKGPADCTVAELRDHYFDCSGYNEADRYLTTKKAIIQYLGQQYGGDVSVTLKTGRMFNVPVPHDPAEDKEDDVDPTDSSIILKTARQKVSYVDAEAFKKEIGEYVKRKQMLQINLEKAFSIILGQCSYDLQKKTRGK